MTEFDANFKGKRIQVLWPDTDTWYNAEVLKVNVKARTATLYYTDTKEKEDINLYEAMLNMEVSWPLRGAAVGTKAATSSKRKGSSDDDSDDEPPPAPAAKKRAKAAPKQPAKSAAPGGNARRVVLGKFAEALRAAQRETSERTGDDPNILAETLEEALHDACADGKEYALKGRSLAFNLNHEKNPGLRAKVLRGHITPEALARMTTAELAPKDLQEMRREREEKIGEDAFVTAEASHIRVVKTSKGEEVVTVGGDAAIDDGDGLGHRRGAPTGDEGPATRPVPPIPSRSPSPGPSAKPEAFGSSVRDPASGPAEGDTTAPAEKPAEDEDEDEDEDDEDDVAPASFASFEAFAAARAGSDDDDEAAEGYEAPAEVEETEKGKEKEEEEEEEYDPAKGFDDDDDDAGGDVGTRDSPKPAPAPEPEPEPEPDDASFGSAFTASLHLSGHKDTTWRVRTVGEAGADVESLIRKGCGESMMIEIKGRTPFSESNKYLRQVRDRSTTRGLTVALATPSTGQDFRNAHSMQRAYKEKERAGLAKGRADGEPWELYLVPRGKLADRLLDEFAGAGAREKMPAKDGTMLWVMVHPKGPAGARAGARPNAPSREPAPIPTHAPPPPSTFTPGVYSGAAPEERLPRAPGAGPTAQIVPPPPPGTTAVPPPPPRSAADEFLSQLSAPPGPASAPTTTFEVPPPPRVAVVPPPPPARDAGASHPAAAGPPPPPGGMDQLLSMTGQLFPNGLQALPPPVSGSGGPGVPGRPPSPRDRGREWVRERGGWRERRDEPPRDGRDGPPYDARGPGPGPGPPGPRSEPFRAGDGWGRDRWPPGGPDRDRWGGWPDQDRDPDRPGGRPGPDRGGRRDDRAPQGPYDRERERDGGRGGGWNTAGRDPSGWPDRERHRDRGY